MGKFKIPVASTSTVKSIRFPDELINEVERILSENLFNKDI